MKRSLAMLAGLALVLGLVSTATAVKPAELGNTVALTPHNIQDAVIGPMTSLITNWGEICVYCHTPHNTNVNVQAPLWNRQAPVGPYQMYDSTWSSTIDMTVDATPTGVSLACLSCHDGTIGLDVIINPPLASSATATDTKIGACAAAGCHDAGTAAGGWDWSGLNLGTDLRNDHPISILYDPTKDTKFVAATGDKVGDLPLYSGKVQCGSCHNPHSEQNRPFLRKSNANSALCLTCHNI